MGIYDLILLFLGVMVISLIFLRHDITRLKVIILFLFFLTVYFILFFSIHHHYIKICTILTGESITEVKTMIQSWGIAAPLMSIILMTLQAVIAPIPAFLITVTNGIVFGIYWGTLISWTGAMCGAIVSFMLSRLFYKSFSEKIKNHKNGLKYLERIESKYGFRVILTARLLPFISFDFISYAAGLSSIKAGPFLMATGIGMLPATVVYTVFGLEMEKLKEYSDKLFTFSIILVMVLLFIWSARSIYKHKKSISLIDDK